MIISQIANPKLPVNIKGLLPILRTSKTESAVAMSWTMLEKSGEYIAKV